MTSARYDLNIDQGSDFAVELTISENGEAKDLSTWSARAQLRKEVDSDTKVDFTCSAPTSVGEITVSLGHAATKLLKEGTYKWGLEIFQPRENSAGANEAANVADTKVTRLLQGSVNVTSEVVR